ncbi:uncharacterized protein LOC144472116 isoform X2 [Augochlora pura]
MWIFVEGIDSTHARTSSNHEKTVSRHINTTGQRTLALESPVIKAAGVPRGKDQSSRTDIRTGSAVQRVPLSINFIRSVPFIVRNHRSAYSAPRRSQTTGKGIPKNQELSDLISKTES